MTKREQAEKLLTIAKKNLANATSEEARIIYKETIAILEKILLGP